MKTSTKTFDETNQFEEWRNGVACELNLLLAHAQFLEQSPKASPDSLTAEAIHSIVQRVAEFEEIQ